MKSVIAIVTYLLFITVAASAQMPAQTVPRFTFSTFSGTSFTNNNLPKNKLLFFMLFDPECDHCQHAMRNINQHIDQYKNAALYLVTTENKEKVNRFMSTYAPGLPQKSFVTLLHDTKNEFVTKFDPIRVPAMYLYNANQKLVDYEDNAESMFRFLKYLKAPIK